MAIKDILVHVDNRATAPARINAAIRVARASKAHLTGLQVSEIPYFSLSDSSAELAREQARQLFLEQTAAAGVEAEWLQFDSAGTGLNLIEIVNFHAHYRDLLIVSQTDVSSGDGSVPADLPDRAVLGAGQPVLVIPYAGAFETIGQRVLLAWRGGPESSRAVNDALPLLQQARSVTILSVITPGGDGEIGPACGDLVGHLARHGVSATAEQFGPTGLSVGDMLLNRAAELGSDLLVMGAYAQTRRGLPGLGEVGRHLLRFMTVPVLMSH